MKKVYDFVCSPGALNISVIWYSVRAGTSKKDVQAKKFIEKITSKSSDFLFALHDLQMANFKEAVANSLFPKHAGKDGAALRLLRQKTISVTNLAQMLRKLPAALLNSLSIDTPMFDSSQIPSRKKPLALTQNEKKPK